VLALVLGVDGQDGSYLAEEFLHLGHRVLGVGRRSAPRFLPPRPGFRYASLDLADADALAALVAESQPDLAFHFAAVHGAVVAGFTYEASWREVIEVNVLALHVLLENARLSAKPERIFYAGSAKVFPQPWQGRLDERSPMAPTCLYSISKLAARDLMRQYAKDHGIRSTNLVFFNHDSPRRSADFLLPQIAAALRAADAGRCEPARVKNLSFHLDWSAADELMGLVADLASAAPVDEVVVASGRTVNARDAIAEVFRCRGHDMVRHVIETSPGGDPGPTFEVDISRLEAAAGRRPIKTLSDIIVAMSQAQSLECSD
jgi:GDPmannose 4,6-dehydratase